MPDNVKHSKIKEFRPVENKLRFRRRNLFVVRDENGKFLCSDDDAAGVPILYDSSGVKGLSCDLVGVTSVPVWVEIREVSPVGVGRKMYEVPQDFSSSVSSGLSLEALSKKYKVSVPTIIKWKRSLLR